MSSSSNIPILQGFKLRTTTGCSTCRKRKVKCDETKPACTRCTRTGRTCDGYSKSPVRGSGGSPGSSRRSSPPKPATAITLPIFENDVQKQFFGFFVSCTSLVSPVYFGCEFWSRRVLQLSLSEPAVLFAICSLSALHRGFHAAQSKASPSMSAGEARNFALQQYNKAVSHTHKLISDSLNGSREKFIQGLVACILFVCFENLIGDFKMARLHLQHGLKLLAAKPVGACPDDFQSGVDGENDTIPSDIVQVLHRLDLQAMSFADDEAPYEHAPSQARGLADTSVRFLSPEHATNCLVHNFKWIFRIATYWEPNPIPAEELEAARKALLQWEVNFRHLTTSFDENTRKKAEGAINVLQMYSKTMAILIATGVFGGETRNYEYENIFREIVYFGRKVCDSGKEFSTQNGTEIFTFEMGAIFPLFFAAIKCRNGSLRREAVALLKEMTRQEGSWPSVAAASVAEYVIRVEEEGGIIDRIVESDHVQAVHVRANIEHRVVEVSCFLRTNTPESPWCCRQEVVSY